VEPDGEKEESGEEVIDLSRYRHTRWLTNKALLPPKNPQGQRQCRWCGTTNIPKGRRCWCGDECVEAYLVRSSTQHVQSCLLKRDRGICAACGVDCLALADMMLGLQYDQFKLLGRWSPYGHPNRFELDWALRDYRRLITPEGVGPWLDCWHGRAAWWEADHIVEVRHGGGCCGLENFQTLCRPCHVRKTKQNYKSAEVPACTVPNRALS
jgi:5-methylcytosine-specific restriction enzyme A